MPDELSAALERLRASAQRLNKATDSALQILRDVEDFLEEYSLGLTATIGIGSFASSPDAEEPDWHDSISYLRIGSRFRLALARNWLDGDPPTVIAWSECTRDDKLKLVQHLPELLGELSRLADEKAERAENLLAQVAPLLPKKKKGGA